MQKQSQLTDAQLDMLRRCALAERFTSPNTGASVGLSIQARMTILRQLEVRGLVVFQAVPTKARPARWAITDTGRAELETRGISWVP